MDIAEDVKKAIDEAIVQKHADSNDIRTHLGASVIGGMCEREIWFSFRWALKQSWSARMLRLFDRGHKEEFRFEEWIEPICEQFWALDPRTGKQIRISDLHGYFGGSLDGVVRNPIGYVGDFLTEFKTHSEKSYNKLVLNGVKDAKPEHYAQMQIYLKYNPKLKGALYFAIRKNDDDLYIEYVERDEANANFHVARAGRIIQADAPPTPHESASEYNFYCKHFCDYKSICDVAGGRAEPARNCRTCSQIEVTEEGWWCHLKKELRDVEGQISGCDKYERGF